MVNGVPQSATANLNVLKPGATLTVKPSQVSLLSRNGEGVIFAGTSKIALNGTRVGDKVGAAWRSNVTNPQKASSGQIAYTQIASYDISQSSNGVNILSKKGDGLDWKRPDFDTVPTPVPPPEGTYEKPVNLASGASAELDDGDSPFLNLFAQSQGDSAHVGLQEDFDLYLMFKPIPNNKKSIWVTLGKASWGWKAAADWPAGATDWKKGPGSLVWYLGQSGGPNSSELPVWTDFAPLPGY
jgi:hypothetical protein